MQVLGHTQLLNNKSMDIHSYVFPNTRPWTNSHGNPWRQNNGFLYITTKKVKYSKIQHETNKTILKLAQAKTECDLLFCVTVTNLSGSQNFTEGPIQKCLPVSFRDCFYLSNQLMVLQNSFSLAFNPTTPHVIIMFNNLTKHSVKLYFSLISKIVTIFFFLRHLV